jgi:hypothetical protein
MKKYSGIMLIAMLSIVIAAGCKKDNSPKIKDYAASVKDQTWWGKLTNTGEPSAYYSVHFNADSILLWSQQSGDYPGKWTINGKKLTMDFPLLNVKITADISDNDTLVNIADNNIYSEVNSGERVANPAIPLDNTVWKGTAASVLATTLRFKPGLKVEGELTNNLYGSDPYERSASGAAIRTELNPGYTLFIVVISANEMRGADNIGYQWKMIKQ